MLCLLHSQTIYIYTRSHSFSMESCGDVMLACAAIGHAEQAQTASAESHKVSKSQQATSQTQFTVISSESRLSTLSRRATSLRLRRACQQSAWEHSATQLAKRWSNSRTDRR